MTDPTAHADTETLRRHLADAIRDGDRKRATDIKAELSKVNDVETAVRPPEERA
jgi:hypothetical protein